MRSLLVLLAAGVALTLPAAAQGQRTLDVAPAGRKRPGVPVAGRLAEAALEAREPWVAPLPAPPPPHERGVAPGARAEAAGQAVLAPEGEDAEPPYITLSTPALGDNNTAIPPDTMGAVGPGHLMVMLNTQVRVQLRDGTPLLTVSLDNFWTSGTGLFGNPFDPRLRYDSPAGRWVATVDANSRSANSAAWFAISDGPDPLGDWTFYAFDADSANVDWADFPGLGLNGLWYAVTNNMFTIADDDFSGAKMWVIDKSSVLDGGSATVTIFDSGFDDTDPFSSSCCFGFALQPAVTHDREQTLLYIADSAFFSSGGIPLLRLSVISGTASSPAWDVVDGGPFPGDGFFLVDEDFSFSMIDAAQAGTGADVDTNDARLSSFSVFRNGRLWITHAGGNPTGVSPNRTNVYWYQLDPTQMPLTDDPIVQSGVVDPGVGAHLFFPSLEVNRDNGACLGFSRSDAGRFVEAALTCRTAAMAAGTMGAIRLLEAGKDSYVKDFGTGQIRWGDYSATSIDPLDHTTFWTIQQYAEEDVGPSASNDRWGTVWGRIVLEREVPSAGPAALGALVLLLLSCGYFSSRSVPHSARGTRFFQARRSGRFGGGRSLRR